MTLKPPDTANNVLSSASPFVSLGGLDHGLTLSTKPSQRYPISTTVAVERSASVLLRDLAGNNLRVYSTEDGTTLLSNPIIADSNGRLAGWTPAPDFDMHITTPGGVTYGQKVRTSPPGVYHINSYGGEPHDHNNWPATPVESHIAAQAAYDAADNSNAAAALVQLGQGVYLFGDSVVPRDNVVLQGLGSFASRIYMKSGVHKPIIDTVTVAGARYPLRNLSVRCQSHTSHIKSVTGVAATDVFTSTAHGFYAGLPVRFSAMTGGNLSEWVTLYVIASGLTANEFKVSSTVGGASVNLTTDITAGTVTATFSLLRLKCYATLFEDLLVDVFPGDGIEMTWVGVGAGANNANTFQHCTIAGVSGVSRHGFFFNNASGFKLRGGLVTTCGVGVFFLNGNLHGYGPYSDGLGQPWTTGSINGYHFEQIDRYAYYSQNGSGVSITESLLWSPVGLDKDSHHNVIQHNTGVSAPIYDGGRDNTTTPNDSMPRIPVEDTPLDRLRPSSIHRDPDFSFRTTVGFTATGGATIEKADKLGAAVRAYDRDGRLPLGILGPANKGVQFQAMTGLTALDTYLFESLYYTSNGSDSIVAQAQFKLVDNATSTVLYDSGLLTRPISGAIEWYDHFCRTVFQVPAGTADIRVEVSTPNLGPIYVGTLDFVKSMIVNGGCTGAYAAGVAPGWAVQSGAGTPTEETALFPQAQKVSVTANQSLFIGQTPAGVIDEDSFYLLKGIVRVVSGGTPTRARIGWGNTDLTEAGSQYLSHASARFVGMDESLSSVFRPSVHTRVLFGITTHSTEPASAVFKDLTMFPLKEVEGPLVYRSDEIDLTAASKNYIIPTPPHRDLRLRRAHFQYSVAATAVGPSVRVGTAGNTTYYGTLGPGVNPQAVGDLLRTSGFPTAPYSRTDIRSGVPIIVTHSGAVANSGKGYVVIEAE